MSEQADRSVRVSPAFMDRWATRDASGNLLTWEWGEPDADGFYTPTITRHDDDNLAANLTRALNGFVWLGNNLENIEHSPASFREFYEAALSDARKALGLP